MTTISKLNSVVTLINVFVVTPERQDELVRLLDEATEAVMKKLDGFVSANIHRSLDGTRVVNYAQWRDEAAFGAMLQNQHAQVHMQKAAALVERFEPVLYSVASIHENP
jgi:quinol monooxygenase YgiN